MSDIQSPAVNVFWGELAPGEHIAQFYDHDSVLLFNQTQQVGFRSLIFQSKVMEQCFRAIVPSHHDQQASENGNPAKQGKELSF